MLLHAGTSSLIRLKRAHRGGWLASAGSTCPCHAPSQRLVETWSLCLNRISWSEDGAARNAGHDAMVLSECRGWQWLWRQGRRCNTLCSQRRRASEPTPARKMHNERGLGSAVESLTTTLAARRHALRLPSLGIESMLWLTWGALRAHGNWTDWDCNAARATAACTRSFVLHSRVLASFRYERASAAVQAGAGSGSQPNKIHLCGPAVPNAWVSVSMVLSREPAVQHSCKKLWCALTDASRKRNIADRRSTSTQMSLEQPRVL